MNDGLAFRENKYAGFIGKGRNEGKKTNRKEKNKIFSREFRRIIA